MSSIEEALYAKLTATTAVTDLVSTRVAPGLALTEDQVQRLQLEESWPQIVYAKQDDSPWITTGGVLAMSRALIRIQCWDLTAAGAIDLKLIVKSTLDGLQEAITPSGGDPIYVRSMFCEDDPFLVEISSRNAQVRYYGAALLARTIYGT